MYSLVVQWLRLSTFTVRAQVQSLVGELRSHKPCCVARKKKKKKKSNIGRVVRDRHVHILLVTL